MKDSITWVGMDDAGNKINVAVFHGQELHPREEFVVINDDAGLGRLTKRLKSLPGQLRSVYEAGVNGYHLQRKLSQQGIACDVAAPSLTPRRAGNRVKTDRRDAKDLARLYRAGELTSIAIPNQKQEAVRDLLRAREDAMEDQQRKRHQLARFLCRRGLKYRAGKAWSRGHLNWIAAIRFQDWESQTVLQEYRLALAEASDRLQRFDQKVQEAAKAPEYEKIVTYLMALRGVKVLTAMTVLAEAIDLKRFRDARAFMAALGLVPSEQSSGEREKRGKITRTGNAHIRRVVIESSWHYRHLSSGSTVRKRRSGLPEEVLAIARQADQRLTRKFWHLVNRGKDSRKAAVATGRELAGFIWAIGQLA